MFAMVDGYVVESGCGLAQSIPWVKVRETTPQVFAMEYHKGQSIKGSNVVTMATWKFDNGGWCLPLVVRVARQLLWWACLGPCQHRWLHWLARWTAGRELIKMADMQRPSNVISQQCNVSRRTARLRPTLCVVTYPRILWKKKKYTSVQRSLF